MALTRAKAFPDLKQIDCETLSGGVDNPSFFFSLKLTERLINFRKSDATLRLSLKE
jgi:hypothetical protein